jgi:hypothetical protein
MTDPTDPTDPRETDDPVERRVRDALAARAASVEPGPADPSALEAALAADDRDRRRRMGTYVGLAAAAAVLVAVLIAVPDRSSDVDTVQTAEEAGSTTTEAPDPTATTPGSTGTSMLPPTSGPTTTATTLAPTTTTTTAPPPTTVVVPPLEGASTDPRTGARQGGGVALMTALRVGRNDGFDRIVLEFRDGIIPEWAVRYVDPPITEDASGEEVPVGGRAFLQIRLDGAQGHDPETAAPIYTGPKRVPGGSADQVVEVVNSGEFEAIYTWVAGLGDRVPFRVQVLAAPARLVIDVAHAA